MTWLEQLAPESVAGMGVIVMDEQAYWPSEGDVRRFLRKVLGRCSAWLREGVLAVMVKDGDEEEGKAVWI